MHKGHPFFRTPNELYYMVVGYCYISCINNPLSVHFYFAYFPSNQMQLVLRRHSIMLVCFVMAPTSK
jgi:hypothetical protein